MRNISVIIPVKNGEAVLKDCLGAVFAQRGLGGEFEVIVVDDGSTDSTAQIARECGARVITQPASGPAAARNTGAKAAGGDLLAFTDADCAPDPSWLKHLMAVFDDPSVVGAKGAYRTRQKSLVARFVQQEYASKYARMARLPNIDFIDTYSAAYRRNVFLENGGFDPVFPVPSVEDQEFSFRLARKGCRMVFVPQAIVYHQHDRTLGEYIRRKYGIGYWKAFMLTWLPEKALSDSHTLPSQRWQLLLLLTMILSLAASPAWPHALWGFLASLALFMITGIPFLAQIAKADPAVLSISPFMLLLRAASQLAGLVIGFGFPPPAHRRPRNDVRS